MTGRHCKKTIGVIVIALLGFGMLLGSCYSPVTRTEPFPSKPLNNSKYTVNFNALGDFYVSDKNGRIVPSDHLPLEDAINASDMKESDWLRVLGSYTLYSIESRKSVWLCDSDFQCYPSQMQKSPSSAVFSLNYDGKKLLIGNALGREITPKDLKDFASLVKRVKGEEKLGIKELSSFKVYKIKGSEKFEICPRPSKCYCTCVLGPNEYVSCSSSRCN